MTKQASKTSPCEQESKKLSDKRLSDTDLTLYKNRLLVLRARIRGDVSTMTDGALSYSRSEAAGDLSLMPLHMADIGSDNFEQEQTLAFIQSDRDTLQLIEDALTRIKVGTYGICESCGNPIPKTRLNVLPYTNSCVRCVERTQEDK
jgi:DnaK suppressor protein